MPAHASTEPVTQRVTLPNGLLIVCRHDDRTPFVALRLCVRAGARYDGDRPGLAHLCEHLACEGGAADGCSHAERLYRAGGDTNGWTTHEQAIFADHAPASRLDIGLSLAAERLSGDRTWITEERLRQEARTIAREHHERSHTLPFNTELEQLQRLLYPRPHPYHWPAGGVADSLRQIARDDVMAFFPRWYRPDRAILVIAGDLDVDRLFGVAATRFAAGPDSAFEPPRVDDAAGPPPAGPHEVVEANVPYARAYVGYRLPGYGHAACRAATLFARAAALGRSSPLRRALIDARIAHDVRVYIDSREAATTVAFVVTALPGVTRDQLDAALMLALERSISGDVVGTADIERARTTELIEHHLHADKLVVQAERLAALVTREHWSGAGDDFAALQSRSARSLLNEGRALLRETSSVRLSIAPRRSS